MQKLWQYKEASEYLLDVPKFTKKNEPQDTRKFWEFLGCPGGRQRIIHVAGTNGKGSVCSYLNTILREMGYTVGMFTSPHLVEMTERVQINRIPVSKEEFTEGFLKVYEAVRRAEQAEKLSSYHPTFFEFLFFISMVLFEKSGVDYIIMETGLGGRLDATNCVPNPILTILTRIGLDHMEYLGDTTEKIAGEKAGIIKQGVPVITLSEPAEAFAVIKNRAAEMDAPLFTVGKDTVRDLCFRKKYIDFSYQSRYYDYIRLTLPTNAVYQAQNAALALKAAEVHLGDRLTKKQMTDAVLKTVWEGRMEEVLPDMYVDGAHNEDGIDAFLESVYQMRQQMEAKRFRLLFSAVKEKNYASMMQKIASSGLFDEIVLAPLSVNRAVSYEKWKDMADEYPVNCCYDSVEKAFSDMLSDKGEEDMIFAAGSLYLVGQIKALL